MVGHLLGAAGAVEFITCVKSIQDGFIHPNVGLCDTEEEMDLNYVRKEGIHKEVDVAMSNSLGCNTNCQKVCMSMTELEIIYGIRKCIKAY